MSASIYHSAGSLTVQLYEGQLLPVQPVGDYYQRLGQTGEGSQEILSLGPDCDIVCHYLTSSLTLARQAQTIAARWQTKFLSITDPTPKVYSSVLAKRVTATVRGGRYAHAGSLYTHRVEISMVLAVQS